MHVGGGGDTILLLHARQQFITAMQNGSVNLLVSTYPSTLYFIFTFPTFHHTPVMPSVLRKNKKQVGQLLWGQKELQAL